MSNGAAGTKRESGGTVATKGGILVLDFGGQYTQLIARRIREHQVFSAIVPCTASLEEIRSHEPSGIVLSGGPNSVYDADAPKCDVRVLELGVPVLGICYGMQWLAHSMGGRVERAERREYGPGTLEIQKKDSKLFRGIGGKKLKIWNSHGDHVAGLPEGFEVTARSENALGAMEHRGKRFYGVEFHPEVNHTESGEEMLRNFVFEISGAPRNWNRAGFIAETVERIRKQCEGSRAICALSGGVDSCVAATLVHRAIGGRLTNIFVNTGLLRRNEFADTLELMRQRLGLNVKGVDSSERFLAKLAGVSDPEKKRKIIGNEFIAVFAEEQKALLAGAGGELPVKFLVQGTLYPDVIESVSVKGPSAVIKSHHNVGGLPKDMPFGLIEPLRDLFKDEVRQIGREMGMPEEILVKHPFPGPGLAVRILGDITKDRLETLRGADAVVVEEIRRAGWYEKVWQAFAVLLPVQTVGVMGDFRTYGNVVAVRVVESQDAMTADWARLPHEVLQNISARIVNEVPGVNRVVYDVSSKPPSTIEWE